MKKIRKILYTCSLLIGFTFILASCDMNQMPNDAIPTEKSWEQVSDAEKFRTGLYSYYQGINGGRYYYASDLQSDIFNALRGFGNNGGQMHKWDFDANDYDTGSFWRDHYACIGAANNIINNIDKLEANSELEQAYLNVTKGDAYLVRAICYHQLALRFSKDYEPGSTELGLPIVTEVDVTQKPDRSSLEDTYQFIKKDIDAALPLLEEGQKELKIIFEKEDTSKEVKDHIAKTYLNNFYMSADVAKALNARVSLYIHQFNEAADLAKSLINSNNYPLVSSEEDFSNMWVHDTGSEIIFRTFSSLDERANPMSYYMLFNTTVKKYDPYYIPNQAVLDLYESTDFRSEIYFFTDSVELESVKAKVTLFGKYPGNPDLKKNQYDRYHMFKPFRIAEMYLVAAEAYYNAGNESSALEFLNKLRVQRGATSLDVSGEKLLKEIKDEWLREFIGEGRRLDDLKRWHEGFDRSSKPVQDPSTIVSGPTYEQLKVESSDLKFMWEIPMNDQRANPNLVTNWGK